MRKFSFFFSENKMETRTFCLLAWTINKKQTFLPCCSRWRKKQEKFAVFSKHEKKTPEIFAVFLGRKRNTKFLLYRLEEVQKKETGNFCFIAGKQKRNQMFLPNFSEQKKRYLKFFAVFLGMKKKHKIFATFLGARTKKGNKIFLLYCSETNRKPDVFAEFLGTKKQKFLLFCSERKTEILFFSGWKPKIFALLLGTRTKNDTRNFHFIAGKQKKKPDAFAIYYWNIKKKPEIFAILLGMWTDNMFFFCKFSRVIWAWFNWKIRNSEKMS